jgi:truncated hemoglobin YjbI
VPSTAPSFSASPSSQPSEVPTGSASPSQGPSSVPSISDAPSSEPSEVPTGSSMPSENPSALAPNITAKSATIDIPLKTKVVQSSLADECQITERLFLNAACSMGNFDPANILVSHSTETTVSFRLKQPFRSVDRFAVWVENPDQNDSADFCWFSNTFYLGDTHDFVASCSSSGFARVSMYGGVSGDRSFQQIGVEDYVPAQHCQKEFDDAIFPEFNPLKRCYWEMKIPCGCDERRLRLINDAANEQPVIAHQVNDTKQERKMKFLEGFLLGAKSQHVTSGSEPMYREAKEVLVEVPKAATATENVGPVDVVNEPKPVKKMRFLEGFLSGSKLYKAATSGKSVHREVKETIENVRPVGESVHREVEEAIENVRLLEIVDEPKPVQKMRFLEGFLSGSKLYKAATSGESAHREVKEATTATEPVAAAVEPLSIVSTGSGDEPQHDHFMNNFLRARGMDGHDVSRSLPEGKQTTTATDNLSEPSNPKGKFLAGFLHQH